ncbi:MAG: OmpA family protein [Oscillospiraceae bacterium]|nr:OmpA family protein [Oscillospiraceae bacterium]
MASQGKSDGNGGSRRRDDDESGENTEGWLTTYSDMVTLLFTFFVLLFAISNVDKEKFALLAAGFGGGMNQEQFDYIIQMYNSDSILESPDSQTLFDLVGSPGGDERTGNEQPTVSLETGDEQTSYEQVDEGQTGGEETAKDLPDQGRSNELDALYPLILGYIEDQDLTESVSLSYKGEFLLMTLANDIWFASGSADVTPSMVENATILARLLSETHNEDNPFEIVIVGHTDTDPIRNARFPSNWDLSVARAVSFLRILINESGLDPSYFSARGYGEEHPIADNSTNEGKQMNRRVEVQISVLKSSSVS